MDFILNLNWVYLQRIYIIFYTQNKRKDDGDLDIQDESGKTIWTSGTIGGIDRRKWTSTGYENEPMVYRYTHDDVDDKNQEECTYFIFRLYVNYKIRLYI